MQAPDTNLQKILEKIQESLCPKSAPKKDSLPRILLAGFALRSRLNHAAILVLSKASLWSECAALVRAQMEMRGRAVVLCSPAGDFAAEVLQWHEEVRSRLSYLGLEAYEAESDRFEFLLAQVTKPEDQDLLRQCYSAKPQPQGEAQQWLRNWHLWPLERLLYEIQKHLIDSPRTRKEIDSLAQYAKDHPVSATLVGLKRYVLIDEELRTATFFPKGNEPWPEGPLALSSACILDLCDETNQAFALGLEDELSTLRQAVLQGDFKGR